MEEKKLLKVGISIGDLNGIGTEIILQTFADKRMFKQCVPIIYGTVQVINEHIKSLGLPDIKINEIEKAEQAKEGVLNVFKCWDDKVSIELGKENKANGRFALDALRGVAADAILNKIDAIVTAPVSKELINTEKEKFVGQTEFFTDACSVSESLMLMNSDNLRVGLVTNHLPVAKVAEAIDTNQIIRKLLTLNQGLVEDFGIERPKIAVLALNPHAGDGGLIGKEEKDVIDPAIKEAKNEGVMAVGPFPADAFFGTGNYQKYDAVLAMYHDQGLIPFKALAFGSGTNVTLGLPIVRTSPDHGPAFDIAGKNMAEASSFRKAIFNAVDIAKHRAAYKEMHKNPIKRNGVEEMKQTQRDDKY